MEGDSDVLVPGTTSCAMCKRMIINAGIETVVVREDKENYTVYPVQSWIDNDDSLTGEFGY
jgi:dCMP deaminase